MALNEFVFSDTSPASNAVAASAVTALNLDKYDWFTIDALLQGGTGGTLDVVLQRFVAQLNEWRDWVRFAQLAAGAAAIRYTLDSNAVAIASIATVGGSSGIIAPVLAAGAVACAAPGQKVRAVYSAGAGTSAGAAQKIVLTGWRRR